MHQVIWKLANDSCSARDIQYVSPCNFLVDSDRCADVCNKRAYNKTKFISPQICLILLLL